jgi:hypothetical protein
MYIDEAGDAHLTLSNLFTLIFPAGANMGEVLQRFSLALTTEPFTTHALSDYEYLDVRFGAKLYYKLKNP